MFFNFREKKITITTLLLLIFCTFSQVVFADDLGYTKFCDKKSKCGFKDKTGKIVIPATFDSVNDFSEGLSLVGNSNKVNKDAAKWGFIDKTGKIVINMMYDSASSFSGGRAKVQIGKKPPIKSFYIDKTGKEVK